MDKQQKAELKRAYRERAQRRGVFQVRCAASGEVWVDAAPDLDTIQNRIWFTLRMGSHRNRALQQAWVTHGPEALAYEVVEVLDEDLEGYLLATTMKARRAHWLETLGAQPCL